MFPQPRWCFALNLEDIMDFCMISEEFEVFGEEIGVLTALFEVTKLLNRDDAVAQLVWWCSC